MPNKSLQYLATAILSLSILNLPAVSHAAVKLNQIQITKNADYTRATFQLNENTKYHVFTLDHPYRVVMDFERGSLNTSLKNLANDSNGILQVRSGYQKNGTLRVVFNMDSATVVKKYIVTEAGPKLIVDIFKPGHARVIPVKPKIETVAVKVIKPITKIVTVTKTEVEAPKKITETVKEAPKVITEITTAEKTVIAKVDPAKQVVEVPVKLPEVQMSVTKRPTIIVIDAGHGGKDPGTVGIGGTKEKDVVLQIATQLAKLINKEPNMKAVLTRDGDYFVTLRDRLNKAHKEKGDLFIAIHADSYFNNMQRGASVYALSRHGATNDAAKWLAKHENDSELGGVDLNELSDQSPVLRSVLIDLAQTATITDSLHMGRNVLSSLRKITTLHYPRVEQAPFIVLKSPDIPSILIETGFLSTPHEEQRLRTERYRIKIANGIFHGLRDYLSMHPTFASNHVSQTTTITTTTLT